ncbi:hypothetical protein KIN20_000650 [Parelaphostrongylus tenuis]|uniref:Galactokinase n=1 Tax=Parelaphostrongylus tenuis TaxID=148309 RepID=A0AAD5MDL7_PARTN|nr:hypothetical protein KIN20_000650 [Parelaphostrongylus tenuis]
MGERPSEFIMRSQTIHGSSQLQKPHSQRWAQGQMKMQNASRFQTEFGVLPTIRVFCPGRVNLIGEHIDYHGYGVLPIAIKDGTEILSAPNGRKEIRIANVDDQYQKFVVELPSKWTGACPPEWFDYVLCGWKVIMDKLGGEQIGFDMLVFGSIPPSSGLSSSSSLVCAAALTTWMIHTGKIFEGITREELADLCAVGEHFIGTQGGGMDQAVQVLAVDGGAVRIDFEPLRSRVIPLPSNACFTAATSQFNERVVEGRLAAKFLLKISGKASMSQSWRLKDVQETLGKSLEEMLSLCDELPEEAKREELIEVVGEEVFMKCLSPDTQHLKSFKLRARAHHVYSEARRVELFEQACGKEDLSEMGRLMYDSHESCKKNYECSCTSLDNLIEDCRSAGAYGARLTGAGWGGCAVALVDASQPIDLGEKVLFISEPSAGITAAFL